MNPHRLLAQLFALTLSATLAACGPGVAGTGTDSVADAFVVFGASASPVCSSSLADGLDCPEGAAAVAAGTGPVAYVDTAAQARVLAVYLGQTVRLEQRCTGLVFVGEWGLTLVGGRYYGIVTLPGESDPEAASLTVQIQADGSQTIQLRDLENRSLVPLTSLHKITLPLAAAQCPQ